jgi:hypothetical protein
VQKCRALFARHSQLFDVSDSFDRVFYRGRDADPSVERGHVLEAGTGD